MDTMLDSGISIISEVWTWILGNPLISGVLAIAVVFLALGGFIGLFVRRN